MDRKGKRKATTEEGPITPQIPLGKQLAHTDKTVRDNAVASLKAFLSDNSNEKRLSEDDISKLWKGLFYCFWMSDKPLIQQSLASSLSNILLEIKSNSPSTSSNVKKGLRNTVDEIDIESSLGYLRGFWEAMVREWEGLDRLRIDKFYMLIRKFVNTTFRLLSSVGWDVKSLERVNEILRGTNGPLNFSNFKIPISLSTHLSDLYLTELNSTFSDPSSSSTPAPLVKIIEPFMTLLANTPSPVVQKRLNETMFEPLLTALSTPDPSQKVSKKRKLEEKSAYGGIMTNSAVNGKKVGKGELKAALLQRFLEIASDEKSRDSNRRKMYQFWREHGGDDVDEDEDEHEA